MMGNPGLREAKISIRFRSLYMIKLVEVYETANPHSSDAKKGFSLRETFINPNHVVCVREDFAFRKKVENEEALQDLDKRQRFSKIYMDRGHTGIDMTVVGSPDQIYETINTKRVLRG
jgi:homoserine acetyltransferase